MNTADIEGHTRNLPPHQSPARARAGLDQLLAALQPRLDARNFVFCQVAPAQLAEPGLCPEALMRENEGITLILARSQADSHGLPYDDVWSKITLSVYSELTAVGLLAAITRRLANAGLCVNVLSAISHDHLFVLRSQAKEAMELLCAGGWNQQEDMDK
jgi:hypothetical protein